jgi:hypothetical protein
VVKGKQREFERRREGAVKGQREGREGHDLLGDLATDSSGSSSLSSTSGGLRGGTGLTCVRVVVCVEG